MTQSPDAFGEIPRVGSQDLLDAITLLVTAQGYCASKLFRKVENVVEKIDFDAGLYFGVLQVLPVEGIQDLSDILTSIERIPAVLVIRGMPVEPVSDCTSIRRTGSGSGPNFTGNFQSPEEGHHWILIDFDKIPLPPGLTLHEDRLAVCEHLISLLPPEFASATYHYQLSSSAGVFDDGTVSMHIWFWLTRREPDALLKQWAIRWNANVGVEIVDWRLFQHVQAHYTAAPRFEGMDDPFPVRSGLVQKACGEVELDLSCLEIPPEAKLPKREQRTKHGKAPPVSFGRSQSDDAHGFEHIVASIGDHEGGAGFRVPLMRAAASYVATYGAIGTDVDELFQLLRDAVLRADCSDHTQDEIEHRASEVFITPLIESALQKFGDKGGSTKPKLLTGTRPHFTGAPALPPSANLFSKLRGVK